MRPLEATLTTRWVLVALAVVVSGLAMATALASARHQSSRDDAAISVTAPTLATKPHGHVTPAPHVVRFDTR
jgi:hypothetical protein